MSKITVVKDKSFTALSNRPIQDEALSWWARGLLLYLLSLSDDWEILVADLINRSPNAKHKTIWWFLDELIVRWYLERGERQRLDSGILWWYNYTLSEHSKYGYKAIDKKKMRFISNTDHTSQSHVAGSQVADSQMAGGHDSKDTTFWVNTQSLENTQNEISKDTAPTGAAKSPTVWKKIKKKVSKKKKPVIWWNPEVSEVIRVMRESCDEFWLVYSPGASKKEERLRASNITTGKDIKDRMQKNNKTLPAFMKNIVYLSSLLYVKEANSPTKLYHNRPDILNQWRKLSMEDQRKLQEKAGTMTPEEKEAKKQAYIASENARKQQQEAEKEQNKQKQLERYARVDKVMESKTSDEVQELKKKFENTTNTTVLRSLHKWYDSPFVKPTRYSFLFTELNIDETN